MVANSLMRTLRQYPYGPTAAADMKALLWSRLYRGASLADASSSLVALHQHRYPCAEGGDPSFALQAADCVRQYREGSHERREFHAGVMAAAQGELGAVIRADLTAAGARVLVSQADLIAYPQADVQCVDDANRFPGVIGRSLDWAGFRHSAYCTASMVAQLNACAQAVRPGGTISISLHYLQVRGSQGTPTQTHCRVIIGGAVTQTHCRAIIQRSVQCACSVHAASMACL